MNDNTTPQAEIEARARWEDSQRKSLDPSDATACSPSSFPARCPACGKPKADGWVKGYHGWDCGSYSQSHWKLGEELRFVQSIECATDHWKQRALRAEYLLTLIPIPPQNR